MTNGKKTESIKAYVEKDCQRFLAVHKDIKKIEFRHRGSVGDSFIKISTVFGTARFFDVSGMDAHTMCVLISVIVAGGSPNVELADLEAIREIEEMFSK